MSNPKRHHFVPEMVLNGFTDEDEWLHWCRVDEKPTVVRRARPTELFYKKHLYSTISEVGVKDAVMERQLSVLESEAAEVVQQIIFKARAGKPATLSGAQKRVWYLFFLLQWRRTPEAQRAAISDTDLLQMLDETLDEARDLFPKRHVEIDALATSEAKARILRNVRIDSLKGLSGNVIGVLEQRGIGILHIPKRDRSFIVGSRPIVRFTPEGHTHLSDPAVEMWLPIASDVAAGVGLGNGGISLHLLTDDRPVRQLNCAIANQSSIIAGCSSALVRSLANQR